MLALFGVTFVAVFVLTSLFIWRGAIRTIPAEPIGRQDRRPDSERLAVQTVDGPGKMLMRRARYLLRQNTEERVLTTRVLPGTDAPTEVSEPVEDGKDLAIVSQQTGIPCSVDTRRTPRDDPKAVDEVPRPAAVSRCLGQQAMSYAMRCPEPGKRGVRNTDLSAVAESLGIKKRSLNDRVYKARLVLGYNEEAVPLVMSGTLSLWKAYDKALHLKRRKDREILDDARERAQLRPMDRLQEQEIAEAA
jgi:hypothetical protein